MADLQGVCVRDRIFHATMYWRAWINHEQIVIVMPSVANVSLFLEVVQMIGTGVVGGRWLVMLYSVARG